MKESHFYGKIDYMVINEIFYSLQGEGLLAGVPSAFIRIAGCPLRCKWCDTKYAWDPSAGSEYTAQQAKEAIKGYPTRHIVITGGEPMTNPELADFLNAFVEPGMHITIETSGIEYVPDLPCDLMSISPKLSNSNPEQNADEHEKLRINTNALKKLIDNYEYQLKFVVDNLENLDEIAAFLDNFFGINPYKVCLMPQATKPGEYLAKAKMLAQVCKQTGFAFSPRLQVLLWSNEKGK